MRYGRIGTDGQSKTTSCIDEDAALARATRLIDEKVRKGYVETDAAVASARAGFEQQLLDNPDDVETLAVYADWLVEHGDPRGEFIQVQLALEDERRPARQRKKLKQREQELLDAHQEEWLGPFAPFILHNPTVTVFGYDRERRNYDFRFTRGFFDTLNVCRLSTALATTLRDSQETARLCDFAVESFDDDDDDRDRAASFLSESRKFTNLRRLRVGEEVDAEGFSQCWCYFHPVTDFVAHMARLEELHLLCKEFDIERLFSLKTLKKLRVLRIYHYGVRGADRSDRARYEYPLDTLAANSTFRNLTHLLFHPHHEEYHSDHYGGDHLPSFLPLDQVEALVRSRHLKKLTHLQLRLSNIGNEGCRLLAESGMLRQLEWLDLRHGCITDEGARVLADCPDVTHLQHLDLSRNGLTGDGIGALQARGVNLRADAQQTDDELAEEVYLREGDFE